MRLNAQRLKQELSGKTDALLQAAIKRAEEVPGTNLLISLAPSSFNLVKTGQPADVHQLTIQFPNNSAITIQKVG